MGSQPAVSAFTGNNVAAAAAAANSNIYNNPSDQQLDETLAAPTRDSNLRIDIPVSSHSPSRYIPSESSPPQLGLPSQSNPSGARNSFSTECAAVDKPDESQTIRRPLADISGGIDSDSGEQEKRRRISNFLLNRNESAIDGSHCGTIVQDPKKDEDVDDKAKESDVQCTFRNVAAEPQEIWTHSVTIWKNGYTIDDGMLKKLDKPENAEFLERVQSLQPPHELNPQDMQIRLRYNVIRRQKEYFVQTFKIVPVAESGGVVTHIVVRF